MKPRRVGMARGYEEMDGANVPRPPGSTVSVGGAANGADSLSGGASSPQSPVSPPVGSMLAGAAPEFELASVSVVPDDTYTVTQAVNALGFGWFQVKLSLCVGLCWMADSMEMTILSVLGPALHCDWGISRYQQALVTTVVFLGMMLSSTFWGHLSDRYGRKPALTLCGVLLFLYGLLSSVAPSFGWLLLLRGLVGFAIGCVPQSVTLYAEFLPTKQRAKCVVLLDCFWALGACFEVALALAVTPTLGWRWLLGLSAAPLFIFAIITPWLPESARYHVTSGQNDKALNTLEQIAKDNRRPMLLGRLVVEGPSGSRGSLKALLGSSLRRTTLLLWFIWMSCAFCYYGLVLMSTELFGGKNKTIVDGALTDDGITIDCQPLATTDYMDLLWTTLAEFPGIFATIYVIEKFGRKKTMALQFLFYAGCVLMITVTEVRVFLTIILFMARGVIAGLFQAAYVYTPEVYPTALRSVGVGGCSALARLGAMATPYIAQVLFQSSIWSAVTVYGIFAACASVACMLLPYETRGADLAH
ncbi:synaptic vesicle 2-related protein [Anopheles arabiensis]|uniref:Major facilitator superfamily (MFS) profile domain-containing protein n=1 Tax=Anopheles arabiensis TaxID=7173 RepID=A0A182I3S5_ANOAR|nr:synaptic vesicle 2-related protein [Anopheles arabiensis]XP_040154943.1 synaptic vesicle 2-related protein [Anopheles arabiensis]